MWGFAPALTRLGRDMGFVPLVITSCVVLYAASWLVDPHIGRRNLQLPVTDSNRARHLRSSGAYPVFEFGRWWTVLTASWLHGSLIHILLNMMSVRNVAPHRRGILWRQPNDHYLCCQWHRRLHSEHFRWCLPASDSFPDRRWITVGASASIAGLIGAVFFYGRRTGSSGIAEQAKMWIMMFLVMGAFIQGIDNWAHLGGLAGGYVCAKFLDPLYPERLDHFIIALGSLVLTAIAIVVSVVHAYWLLANC